jgi:hypothetical protein
MLRSGAGITEAGARPPKTGLDDPSGMASPLVRFPPPRFPGFPIRFPVPWAFRPVRTFALGEPAPTLPRAAFRGSGDRSDFLAASPALFFAIDRFCRRPPDRANAPVRWLI